MRTTNDEKKNISISLPINMIEALKRKAEIDKRTISDEIEYLLEDKLMEDSNLQDIMFATTSGFTDDLNDEEEDKAWAMFQ
ncbi:MAG: hypothetical protein OEZ36_13465 [Spirochaetota bacterium]|nr:hypothetical protein [Spirochaetota bacterium]